MEQWGINPLGKWTEISVVITILGITITAIWILVRNNDKQRVKFIEAWQTDTFKREERTLVRLDRLEDRSEKVLKDYHDSIKHIENTINERNILVKEYIHKTNDLVERLVMCPCLLMHPSVNPKTRRRILVELGIVTKANHAVKKIEEAKEENKELTGRDTWEGKIP